MRWTTENFHPTFEEENVLEEEGVFQVPQPNNDALWVAISLLNLNSYLMNLVSKCRSERGLSPHI